MALHLDPLAIVIVTPIMQRAHSLREASQIAFVDSTASCDCESHSLTFILAPCAAGAVPLGVCITGGQSAADYRLAFTLFKAATDGNSFGGQGFPLTFVTDDSEAEQAALKEVWPESLIKLCLFHVQQAVWRWLWETKHGVDKDSRKLLMGNFQLLVRCTSTEEMSHLYDTYMNSELWNEYPQWQNYVQGYWERRQLWSMAWRDSSMMGHTTNNYSESTIRLFKDIILGRCKAYNVVTLVDFTCTVMEDYYRHRLRSFSQARVHKPRLLLESELRKAAYLDLLGITSIDEDTFSVPSEQSVSSGEPIYYVVNSKLGTCTCAASKAGRFCKHQAGVWKLAGGLMPSLPAISAEARHQMAVLALGDKAAPASFYSDFVSAATAQPQTQVPMEVATSADTEESSITDPTAATGDGDEDVTGEDAFGFDNVLEKLHELHQHFSSTPGACRKIMKRLSHITTATQWETFLQTQGAGVSCVYRSGSAIRVQPTALSRRRPAVTRGSRRIAAGRPPLSAAAYLRKKRARALSFNIGKNQPNAKPHGRAH